MSYVSVRWTKVPRFNSIGFRGEAEKALLRSSVLITKMLRDKAKTPHQKVRRRLGATLLSSRIVWDITPPRAHPIPKTPKTNGFLVFQASGATRLPAGTYFARQVMWRPFNPPKADRYAPVLVKASAAMKPILMDLGYHVVSGLGGSRSGI